MIGVIYARYSEGSKQTEQSIEGQVADCKAYAEANGIQIVEIYADRHISGKSLYGRDEFQRMLYDASKKKFDCVIVWKIDRFGRNRQDIAVSKMKLKKYGVELKYARESVPEGPEGIILESVLEGLAEYYSADLKQKVTRGIRESAKKGRYCGASVPIGYKLDSDRHVVIDEDVAPFVRQAFSMYANGAKIDEIIEMFTRAGIMGQRSNKPLTKAVINRMMRNERYIGIWELAGVELNVPGIVDKDLFAAVQDAHTGGINNAAGKALVNYLLSGKCVCSYCGARVNAESGRGKGGTVYHYYKCSNKKRGSKCVLKPIRKLDLETAVIESTISDMLTDKTIDALTKRVMELQEKDDQSDVIQILNSRLSDAEKRRKNLLRLVEASGDMDLDGVPERLFEISEEIKDLKGQIIKEELHKPRVTEESIRSWLSSFRDGDKDDDNFKHRLVDTFIDHIELSNDSAMIVYTVSDSPKRECSIKTHLVDLMIPYSKPTALRENIVLKIKL